MDDTADHKSPPEGANQPSPQSESVPENNAPHAKPRPKGDKPKGDNTLDRSMVRWTRVVGVFTFVLSVIGGVQTWAFIQGQRAAVYVRIEKVIPTPIVADKPLYMAITVVNNGPSQAFITEGIMQLSFYYDVPDQPSFLKTSFDLTGVIPAHGSRFWQLGPTGVLNWAQVAEIDKGKMKVLVFGFVAYTDDFTIFGPHRVGFCGVYDPSESVLPLPPLSDCGKPAYVYYK